MGGDAMSPWELNLKRVYDDYCPGYQNAKMMDGKSFAKLVKDCNLLDSRLTETDVDITFAKIKDRAERRITYTQFQNGLTLIAKKKGIPLAEIQQDVDKRNGPILHGTRPESNKLHDDRSLYTGVHANGGPETVDKDRITDVADILDRSPSDVRGVKKDSLLMTQRKDSAKKLTIGRSKSMPAMPAPCGDSRSLREKFRQFCGQSQKTMDAWEFAKLCRDGHLLDDDLTATDVDLIFLKVKDRAEKRISYDQFLVGLALLAQKKGVETKLVEMTVKECTGPVLNATHAEPNRFYDDKANYTGVHAHSDPNNVETDRHLNTRSLPPSCRDTKQMREVFKQYSSPGQKTLVMDSAYFTKLAKDCQLIDDNLQATDVDLIFVKVKDREEKRITYQQFLQGLALMAQRKGAPNKEVEEAVLQSEGPILNATRPESNKLHDDKSYYTGVHVHGGPSVIDHNRVELSNLLDRSDSDIRGVKDHSSKQSASGSRTLRNAGARMMGIKQRAVPRGQAGVADSKALQRVFRGYAQGEPGMSSAMLVQLVRDTRLLDHELTVAKVEAVFAKAKSGSERRLGYEQFLEVLAGIAGEKGMHMEALVARVEWATTPSTHLEPSPVAERPTPSASASRLLAKGKKKQPEPAPTPPRQTAPADSGAAPEAPKSSSPSQARSKPCKASKTASQTSKPAQPAPLDKPSPASPPSQPKVPSPPAEDELTVERVKNSARALKSEGREENAVLSWLRQTQEEQGRDRRELESQLASQRGGGSEADSRASFKLQDRVWYTRADGSRTVATVLSVDYALQPPSYVVEVDGSERETERSRLEPMASSEVGSQEL